MTRKRMIDPSIWQDEDFGQLSMTAKLLFIGLFSNADDEGRIRANNAFLKSTVFMYEDLSLDEVLNARSEVLSVMKSVKMYSVDNKEYIQLSKWEDYQKQHKDRIQPSTLPPYQGDVSDNVGQVTDIVDSSDVTEKGIQNKKVYTNTDPINSLIALFKDVNPNYERLFPNTSQRKALSRMVEKHGREKIERCILSLAVVIKRPFAPRITTPMELEMRMGSLIAFLQQQKTKSSSGGIVEMPQQA